MADDRVPRFRGDPQAEADARAQAAADRLYAGVAGPLWRVAVGGWPSVLLPAADRAEAVARYNAVTGVTGSEAPHAAGLVEDYPAALPCGLKELAGGGDGQPG